MIIAAMNGRLKAIGDRGDSRSSQENFQAFN
jgi:hypothetical protein